MGKGDFVTGVFIVADSGDKKMWETLPELLRGGGMDILVSDIGRMKDVEVDNAVVVFSGESATAAQPHNGMEAVAVVNSGVPASIEAVSKTGMPAITCGFSPRDTMTLSSFDSDSAVLSLQRGVKCFDGSVEEPREIPLKLAYPLDSFTLMAAASVYILCGRSEELEKKLLNLH